MSALEYVIKAPKLSEKASEIGEKYNSYTMIVDRKCSKNQVRAAVEKFYDVKVKEVRTLILPGKTKRVGRTTSKSQCYKKAIVKLAEGQKLDFFKNV